MKILITGGSGFIGSHIAKYLSKKNFKIIITTRKIKNCFRIKTEKSFKLIEGDIANIKFIQEVFKQNKPDIIIHGAWNGIIKKERNIDTQITNINIMNNLLTAAGKYKIKLFIGLGSQAEYGVYNKKIKETFSCNPETLYGIYKLSSCNSGLYYSKLFSFKFAWLRIFPTFGPGDNINYLIPYVIKSMLNKKKPKVTLCDQKLDFLYVKDIPPLILNIINTKKYFSDIYNLCSGSIIKSRNMLLLIKDILQTSIDPDFGAVAYRKDGLMCLTGSNKKFKKTFGWTKLTDKNKALEETINWYKQNL